MKNRWFIYITFTLILLTKSIFSAELLTPLDTLAQGYIVDVHCHTAGIGAGGSGCFIAADMLKSYKFKIYLKAFEVTQEDLLQYGDALILKKLSAKLAQSHYVKAAIILAIDGAMNDQGELDTARTQVYIPNSFVAKEIKKYPNLLFGASINPLRKNALQELDKVAHDNAKLIKWIPSIQHFDPSDERFIPFYKKMVKLGLPLLTHTGHEFAFNAADNALCDPEKLRLPLSLGVTVIAAHVATPGKNAGESNMLRLMKLFSQYPNLYADISSLTQINKLNYLHKALSHPEAKGRLLYGTDMPLLETPLVSPLFFSFSLSPKKILSLENVKNPWDRDVELKQALGVSSDIFFRTAQVLRIYPATSPIILNQKEIAPATKPKNKPLKQSKPRTPALTKPKPNSK